MSTVPSGTRFIGIADNVSLVERKSAVLNADTQPYTIEDLVDTIGVGAQGPQGVQGPAGPLGPVGPAGLNWQGSWVSGTSYVADDAVGYDGASWFCILATSGTTAPDVDTTHWALLASQGAQGPQGVQGPTGPQGASGGAGTLQQTVTNGNTFSDEISGDTTTIYGGVVGVTDIFGNAFLAPYQLQLGKGDFYGLLQHPGTFTANRTYTLPNASGTIALTTDVTLQKAVNGGNTITDNGLTTTLTNTSIKVGESSTSGMTLGGSQIVCRRGTGSQIMILQFPSTLTTARQITLPNASGTVALKTYNETVILLSYDGTNFTYTNVINELGVTITFLVASGTLYCTLSSSVLTLNKTIIWASSFIEFGGYLTQASRDSGNSFRLDLTNTNGTNDTFPTSFYDLPIRIQVYN